MTERMIAGKAHQLTREALAAEYDLDPFVEIIDAAIENAISNGDWTIQPLAVLEAKRIVLETRYIAALRRHYEERDFRWLEPLVAGRSAIETQGAVKLSWE